MEEAIIALRGDRRTGQHHGIYFGPFFYCCWPVSTLRSHLVVWQYNLIFFFIRLSSVLFAAPCSRSGLQACFQYVWWCVFSQLVVAAKHCAMMNDLVLAELCVCCVCLCEIYNLHSTTATVPASIHRPFFSLLLLHCHAHCRQQKGSGCRPLLDIYIRSSSNAVRRTHTATYARINFYLHFSALLTVLPVFRRREHVNANNCIVFIHTSTKKNI